MIQRFASILNDPIIRHGFVPLKRLDNFLTLLVVTPLNIALLYQNKNFRMKRDVRYFPGTSLLLGIILWINQIFKDNDIKGSYKVDKSKPTELIDLITELDKRCPLLGSLLIIKPNELTRHTYIKFH